MNILQVIAVVLLIAIMGSGDGVAGFEVTSPYGPQRHSPPARSLMTESTASLPKKHYRDGELLVKFKPGVTAAAKHTLHKKHGAEKLKDFPSLHLQQAKLKHGQTVEEAIKRYQADPDVAYVEPNFLYKSLSVPNDPYYSELWEEFGGRS